MIQTVQCKTCRKECLIPLGKINISLSFEKSKACDKCYKIETDSVQFFFCSVECFQVYAENFAKKGLDFTL